MTRGKRRLLLGGVTVGVAALALVAGIALTAGTARPVVAVSERATGATDTYRAPSGAELAALPEAKYDAVIPGLIAYKASAVPTVASRSYTLREDTAVYGTTGGQPVARLDAENFLNRPTVVVPVALHGAWALVLTPSRQGLPSSTHRTAPAQTAGWVRRSVLKAGTALADHIVISVGSDRLAIVTAVGTEVEHFTIGVGAAGTPTPTGVLGYLQARYLDPQQGQSTYPINLTSMHATAADEPYEGHDGGLIGMHFHTVTNGSVSHGCLRLPPAALQAIDRLPLGTPVLMQATPGGPASGR